MTRLARDVRRRRFDLVIDFHSFRETNLLARISGAHDRIAMKRYKAPYLGFCFNRPPVLEDKALHVSEMFQKIVGAITGRVVSPAASFVLPEELRSYATMLRRRATRRAIHRCACCRTNLPPERFAAVADFVVETLVRMFSCFRVRKARTRKAPGKSEPLPRSHRGIHRHWHSAIDRIDCFIATAGEQRYGTNAHRHRCGVCTLGLFSVGYPEHSGHRWCDRFIKKNPIEKIETEVVIGMVEEMWATANPGLRY